ncbi:MAG: DUF2066 domain-containing protein [Oceanicaulis sp.]
MALLGIVRTAAAAVAGVIAAASMAAAQFTVSGIAIDAEANTAFEAQRRALAEGQTRAANILVNRLTLPEDRMEAQLAPMTAETAAGLIAGLQIADEQRSSTRYRARITVQFDPREVRNYFSTLGVPYVQSVAAPILVVPVLDGEAGPAVRRGPWYEAWAEGGFEHALTPMIPLRADDRSISADEALSLDPFALQALADAYGAEAVAVIRARGGEGGVRAAGDIVRFAEDGEQIESIATVAAPGFEAAAERIVQRQEEQWKRNAIVRGGDLAELQVTVLFDSLREWRSLQSAVAGASLIQNARLDALSKTGAVMTLSHRGAREQVRAELAARGADFAEDPELGWTVRRR